MDFIPNHASTEAEYFIRSEARDPVYENWFIWEDPIPDPNNASNFLPPSNWLSAFGGSMWEWSEARQQYYLHQFAIEQADFNFREPAVHEEMLNIMRFWLDKGVDGLRLDAVNFIYEANPADYGGVYPSNIPGLPSHATQDLLENYGLIHDWRAFTDKYVEENGGDTRILLGEAYANISRTMLFYGNQTAKGCHFPFNFNFVSSFPAYITADSTARDWVYVIMLWLIYMPSDNIANWTFGNHDNPRMPDRFRPEMVDGLNAMSMILPGVSVTYQGEEIGMNDGFVSWEDTVDVQALNTGNEENYMELSRDPYRTPFHWDNTTSAGFSTNASTWLPIAQDYLTLNLRAQKEAPRSHYKVYQAMVALRQQPALSHGFHIVDALSENTMFVLRYLSTFETYLLVLNVSPETDVVNLTRIRHINGPLTVYTSSIHSTRVKGDEVPFGTISLHASEALVLRAPPVDLYV